MSLVDLANGMCKAIVRLLSTHVFFNIELCEYKNKMPSKLWPLAIATSCLVVDFNDVNPHNDFPMLSGTHDPASQTSFERLHNTNEDKWNQEDYIPNGNEVYMGRMSIKNKVYAIWWRDDQEAYVAQEWTP